MSAFYENHIRARKLARSPEHYAALVEVFCEIDRIAARIEHVNDVQRRQLAHGPLYYWHGLGAE